MKKLENLATLSPDTLLLLSSLLKSSEARAWADGRPVKALTARGWKAVTNVKMLADCLAQGNVLTDSVLGGLALPEVTAAQRERQVIEWSAGAEWEPLPAMFNFEEFIRNYPGKLEFRIADRRWAEFSASRPAKGQAFWACSATPSTFRDNVRFVEDGHEEDGHEALKGMVFWTYDQDVASQDPQPKLKAAEVPLEPADFTGPCWVRLAGSDRVSLVTELNRQAVWFTDRGWPHFAGYQELFERYEWSRDLAKWSRCAKPLDAGCSVSFQDAVQQAAVVSQLQGHHDEDEQPLTKV